MEPRLFLRLTSSMPSLQGRHANHYSTTRIPKASGHAIRKHAHNGRSRVARHLRLDRVGALGHRVDVERLLLDRESIVRAILLVFIWIWTDDSDECSITARGTCTALLHQTNFPTADPTQQTRWSKSL